MVKRIFYQPRNGKVALYGLPAAEEAVKRTPYRQSSAVRFRLPTSETGCLHRKQSAPVRGVLTTHQEQTQMPCAQAGLKGEPLSL